MLGARTPTPEEWRDIRFGFRAAKVIGQWDIGQSVVVATAPSWPSRASRAPTRRSAAAGSSRGDVVVVKVSKPTQDTRFDVPAVGPDTMRDASPRSAAGRSRSRRDDAHARPRGDARAADAAGIAVVAVDAGGGRRMSHVRAAVVGVGYLGRFHAEKYAGPRGVELVGVVDVDAARAQRSRARSASGRSTDYRALLGRVDCVSVAVPTPAPPRGGRATCSRRGIDVLVEKPLTATVDEGEARSSSWRSAAGASCRSGTSSASTPRSARSRASSPSRASSSATAWRRSPSAAPTSTSILDLMIHDLDVILSMVPSPVARPSRRSASRC